MPRLFDNLIALGIVLGLASALYLEARRAADLPCRGTPTVVGGKLHRCLSYSEEELRCYPMTSCP